MNPQHRRLRAGWLPLLLACAFPAQALQFQPPGPGLTHDETSAAQAVLAATGRLLPGAWSEALGEVRVEWRDDLPPHVHGRALRDRVLLRRDLLAAWPASGRSSDPGARAALAALVHELAHLYDRTPRGRLSRDPRLLDLAGWQVAPLRPWRTRNGFTDRSPDAYERTGPAEFVAVNLEHFLLDPEYACRRPALHRLFAAHFRIDAGATACPAALPFVQAGVDAGDPLLAIDPERVHAVDYLLAEGNDRPMSRWGHSMLRLVVCAPERPRGPDCRLDLSHHRVISFRAFVDDVQISSWRGLTGSYPSRLFVLPLDQVIEEYNRIELRGLRSIPLRLGRDEIATLLERAAQLHWSYDGRYYFVSNNCAVETYKLLHDGVPRLAGAGLSSITPTGLLRRLERAGIADSSVLDDRGEALRLGYYFEPLDARYQAMFEVARASLGLPQADVREWLDLPPQQRSPWTGHADLRSGAALLLLEHAALRRQHLRARDALKRRLFARGADREGEAVLGVARELLRVEGLLGRPAMLVPGEGYGLPQRSGREAVSRQGAVLAGRWLQQRDALLAQAREWLTPESLAALDATEANIDALGRRLRRLHEGGGGVQLH